MLGRDDDVLARGERRIGGLGQEKGLEAAGGTKPYGDCARGSIHVESYLWAAIACSARSRLAPAAGAPA